MKKTFLLAFLFVTLAFAAACTPQAERKGSDRIESGSPEMPDQVTDEESAEVASSLGEGENSTNWAQEIDTIISSVKELKAAASESPEKVKELGEKLHEDWEVIEEEVEEKYPDDYKNIEDSLYPLIGEANKDQPDMNKITGLSDEVITKLEAFKKKIASR
ncbi:hypothetical protein [Bacillus marinisedimentorum]|uniref:hypothetical protein n=1 Tax=Bacillus marinisedimentorum TaxID=1821260 RepID=UPI0007DF230A|nr:hypothetical protein [Bacillus marinisedimentorum]